MISIVILCSDCLSWQQKCKTPKSESTIVAHVTCATPLPMDSAHGWNLLLPQGCNPKPSSPRVQPTTDCYKIWLGRSHTREIWIPIMDFRTFHVCAGSALGVLRWRVTPQTIQFWMILFMIGFYIIRFQIISLWFDPHC